MKNRESFDQAKQGGFIAGHFSGLTDALEIIFSAEMQREEIIEKLVQLREKGPAAGTFSLITPIGKSIAREESAEILAHESIRSIQIERPVMSDDGKVQTGWREAEYYSAGRGSRLMCKNGHMFSDPCPTCAENARILLEYDDRYRVFVDILRREFEMFQVVGGRLIHVDPLKEPL